MHHLKILVIGPKGSGKTTIIQNVTNNTVTTDVDGRTVGLDFGTVETKDLVVHLFGSPGLQQFSLVRKALASGSDGVVLVIDSTDPQSVIEGEQYLHDTFGANIPPLVVAANKQDVPGAMSPQEIQSLLSVRAQVYPTSAQQGLGLVQLLDGFVKHLLQISKGGDILTTLRNA
ncbi:MAG: ATP/GTP-binding protein [Promethearchaeota archaeon]